ncbi:MAG TPA: STAS domain-containing protein [Frankiaceae bacterium]|jgi:anti-anti-sigma factor|nr:STAS domain-containing protein [Frankiaceae bacterium]
MTTLLPSRLPGTLPVPARLTNDRIGEVCVVRCAGDLDLAAVDTFTSAVDTALADRPTGLVLDLSHVGFCDTVGLRILLSAAARARRQGCSIALASVRRPVAELLARVCADRALPAYPDVADAIEGLMFSGDWR